MKSERRFEKLENRIRDMYGSIAEFSRVSGISKSKMSLKLSGSIGFTKEDIRIICYYCSLAEYQIGEYFFPNMVQVV